MRPTGEAVAEPWLGTATFHGHNECQLDEMQKHLPVIVGEWSCGLPSESLRGLDAFEKRVAERAFGDAQLMSYETSRGWFFWNYRTESEGGWNFHDCVKRGSLPSQFDNV